MDFNKPQEGSDGPQKGGLFSFNLGGGLPKLGDKDALNSFMADQKKPMFGGSLPQLKKEPPPETPSIFSFAKEEKKPDFPPPINSLFSFDLPGLVQNQQKDTQKYNLTNLETNAKSYLDQMKDEEPESVPVDLGATNDTKHDFQPKILADPPRGMFPSSIMSSLAKKAEAQARPPLTPGDMISSKYHTYNSIGTLAPLVTQDENLSLTLNSNNVKMFMNADCSKNLIFFIENSDNISFLVNQTEQISNILSGYHSKGKLQGTILDFTVRQFRFLYLLYAKSIVILDIKGLLESAANDLQIVESIQLNSVNQFSCIEVANNEQSLVLFSDVANKRKAEGMAVLHIDCSTGNNHAQTIMLVGDENASAILDIEIWDTFLALLLDRNLIVVFDLAQRSSQKGAFEKPVFRAKFADTTESISQLFFVKDFQRKVKEDSSNDEESQEDDLSDRPDEIKKLRGHFLLIETKKTADKKSFRKLHIVEIQDPIGPISLTNPKQASKLPQQAFKQIDQLTITEHTSKFVSYDYEKGIVFLLNQEKSDRLIKFFSVKLKREVVAEDSDSDEATGKKDITYMQRLRFEYITEVRFQLSNQSFSAIQKASQSKSKNVNPTNLNVLSIKSLDQENYYIYTNILDQVLVFVRLISEMTPSTTEMVKVMSSGSPMLKQDKAGVIDLSKLGQIPNTYKEKILKQSRDMMTSSKSDQEIPVEEEEDESDAENMVNNILGDESDDYKEKAKAAMDKIDQECKEEEENDAKLLQKKIKDETKDLLSEDEQQKSKKKNFIYVKKEASADEPQLSKKERKKLAKKEKTPPKDASKKKAVTASPKVQDSIVENFQELTRKYQDLAQKMNQLQQQVNRQQQQKIEVETVIRKAVKEGISSLVTQQIKEIVVPIITKKMKTLDEQVNDLMPKIEDQIGKLFFEIIEKGEQKADAQVTPNAVQGIIQREFREAMSNQIIPQIEQILKKSITQLEQRLQQVDVALCEKLAEDEEKNEQMVQHYQNSLVWLKMFHQKVGNLAKDQLKSQMQQQVEYTKEMAREFQNEMQSQMQNQLQMQIQMQVQQQVQFQVQQYMSNQGGTPWQMAPPTQPQFQMQRNFNMFGATTQKASQSQIIQSEPPNFDFEMDSDKESRALMAQMNEIQKKLKARESIKLKQQMSSSKGFDDQFVQDKNIMAIKVGKRPVLMYDNDTEEEKPKQKLSKHQESKLRGMIDDDQFIFSEFDKAYEKKQTQQSDEEEVGNRYAAEPRVKAEEDSDEEQYKMPKMRPYDNDLGAMRLLNQLQKPKEEPKDHSEEIENLMYKGLTQQHAQRIRAQNEALNDSGFDGNKGKQRVMQKMQFGASSNLLNSSLEGESSKKGQRRELTSWKDSKTDDQGFSGYGIIQPNKMLWKK